MRVRKKNHLEERLESCSEFLIFEPEGQLGKARSLFSRPTQPLHVEIGCGKGKFVCENALAHPEINYIAIEKVSDVLVMAVEKAKSLALPNVLFLRLDAKDLLKFFTPHEIDGIYLNFSDPWKKHKQAKRRLTHSSFLVLYEKLLTAEGTLQFKTDNFPLFEFSLGELRRSSWAVSQLTYDLHEQGNPPWNIMTEYEESWLGKGAKIHRVVAQKTASPL